MNSKLFKKSIDLKRTQIFGGRNDATYKECVSSIVREDGCTVETTDTYNDKNQLIESCDIVTCPE